MFVITVRDGEQTLFMKNVKNTGNFIRFTDFFTFLNRPGNIIILFVCVMLNFISFQAFPMYY